MKQISSTKKPSHSTRTFTVQKAKLVREQAMIRDFEVGQLVKIKSLIMVKTADSFGLATKPKTEGPLLVTEVKAGSLVLK